MALNKPLNATCDLDGYLFCRMPADTFRSGDQGEDQMGKYSMFQDTYTHTEKYCAWYRADRRSSMQTRRRRTPCREVRSSHEDNNIMSERDVPVGQGLRYPLRCLQILSLLQEVSSNKFLGKYCDFCMKCGEKVGRRSVRCREPKG